MTLLFLFPNQVLATGLSGLYSSLPTKLEEKGEDWHCILKDDWLLLPALVQFMNSLEFCNAVIQVLQPRSHRGLLGSSLAGVSLCVWGGVCVCVCIRPFTIPISSKLTLC